MTQKTNFNAAQKLTYCYTALINKNNYLLTSFASSVKFLTISSLVNFDTKLIGFTSADANSIKKIRLKI